MNTISKDIKNRLFKTWLEKVPIAEFENWVYSSTELKDQMDSDSYYEFLSFNYKKTNAISDLKNLIELQLTQSELETWNLKRHLTNVKERNNNCTESIRKFYTLNCKGYDFMDSLAFNFSLKLEVPYISQNVVSFEELTEVQKEKIISDFYPEIQDEINKVMSWLENENIVLLGKSNEFGKLEYIDNRTESQKAKKNYTIKKSWWKFWK
ncbi:hypothetical protein [Psychroserpens mesophilus]|uniref:hypothetical protein n=1 Tax=Psychroserpens mesophilus TaxID=325473 RepID=UPI00126A0D5B|nr:hypothetical protein [Psychroserpens mesophilus]